VRFLLPALLLVLAAPAEARGLKITLLEQATGRATHFAFDTRTGAWRRVDGVIGVEVRRLASYRVRDRRLVAGGKALTDADEILSQCRVDGTDVVVVRTRERTLSSPWKLLSACGGHPVEASVVSVLVVEGGAVARRQELARSEDSHAWSAVVLE
jgi:hypothetical protein